MSRARKIIIGAAEFTEVCRIEADFKGKVKGAFNKMIDACAAERGA